MCVTRVWSWPVPDPGPDQTNLRRPLGSYFNLLRSKIIVIGSDNGLSPVRRQTIIWTNAGILLIGFLGINFSGILLEINIFSFKKKAFETVVYKTAPVSSRPQWVYAETVFPGIRVDINFQHPIMIFPILLGVDITLTSHYRHGVSKHQQLYC